MPEPSEAEASGPARDRFAEGIPGTGRKGRTSRLGPISGAPGTCNRPWRIRRAAAVRCCCPPDDDELEGGAAVDVVDTPSSDFWTRAAAAPVDGDDDGLMDR